MKFNFAKLFPWFNPVSTPKPIKAKVANIAGRRIISVRTRAEALALADALKRNVGAKKFFRRAAYLKKLYG